MNCEECQDRVLELLERESIDRHGVEEILAACPDCRKDFDALKAAVALAGELPREKPPAHVDREILKVAAARHARSQRDSEPDDTRVLSVDPSRTRMWPWTVAAVAVLGIGIGLWSGGDDDRLARVSEPFGGDAVEESYEDQARDTDQPARAEPALALAEAAKPAEAGAKATSAAVPKPQGRPRRGAQRVPADRQAKATDATPQAAQSERREAFATVSETKRAGPDSATRSAPDAPAKKARAGAGAPSSALVAETEDVDERANKNEAARAADLEGDGATAAGMESAPSCRDRLKALDTKQRADPKYVPPAQQQLEIGLCYVELDQPERAKPWLERASRQPETADRAKKALKRLE
ncbi:MAG: hypothetical protein AAF500_00250 [Myxococcota bacterium]